MYRKLLITIAIYLFFAGSASAQTFVFTKTLRLGDNNQDVKQLQIFLNKSSDTRIALSGIGSPGNESTYFGSLTMKAVMSFQAKYKTEILVPSGLTSPTGFVGLATIKKINSLINSTSIVATNNQTVVIPPPAQNILPVSSTGQAFPSPIISTVSKVAVNTGDKLVLTGKFPGTSAVYLNDIVASSKTISQSEIDVVVPSGSGIYLVWVSNEYGDSRADFPMFVMLGNSSSGLATLNISGILNKITAQNNIIHNKAIDPANQ